ncbi:MAG: YncE family protein [Acidobacteriota bacterium]
MTLIGVLSIAGLALPAFASEAAPGNRVVRDGVVLEFSIAPADGGERKELMEGDQVEVKFRLTDEGTGNPLNSLYPGAWINVGEAPQARGAPAPSCKERVSLYLKNIVGMRPLLDLNSYFLLVLNNEASISVIDPRVGITGRTNLFAKIPLKEPGVDWVKTRDHKRLFVSMPKAGQVAAVATENFKVTANVEAGVNPVRVILQTDEKYLWVGNDAPEAAQSGVTVIDAGALRVAARIPTGRGHHEIVFSGDDRYAFVSNREEGTVSVIDIRQLKKVKDLGTGPLPISLAYSPLSRAVYVADGREGAISVVDSERHEVLARIPAKPGLGPLRFTPDGRWGFVVNSIENAVHVVDAATNRLMYTVPVEAEPYQIAFTQSYAHIRSLGAERVSLINLAYLGKEAMPPPLSYAAGASPPNKMPELSLAGGMAPSPKEAAVYVLSPADNAIYHYMEGMAAPSGSFRTYGQSARAIEIIDRSLREEEPGVYSTKVELPVAGAYDVAFLLDSPSQVHCFNFAAKPNPARKRKGPALAIEYLTKEQKVMAGEATRFPFRLTDPESGQPRLGLQDVRVQFYMVPGLHRTEAPAREISEGIYEAALTLPQAGAYYIYVASPSSKVRYGDLPYRTLMAVREESKK